MHLIELSTESDRPVFLEKGKNWGQKGKEVNYPERFKEKMVLRMTGPGGLSANALSEEVEVRQTTLSRWLRQASTIDPMKDSSKSTRKEGSRRPQDWTAEERLRAVIDSAGLRDAELGAFLRRAGLHEVQLEQWRQDALQGLSKSPTKSRGQTPEEKRIRELEKELRRKEKALAETAALLVLKKKAEAIWGAGDENTSSRKGK
jgi:transposase-like protein